MQTLTLTTLRSRLFQVADQVLESGQAVVIERNGRKLLLTPQETSSKLSHLQPRSLIVGNPEDLVELKVSEWREPENLV